MSDSNDLSGEFNPHLQEMFRMQTDREMTLAEWVERLHPTHRARQEFEELRKIPPEMGHLLGTHVDSDDECAMCVMEARYQECVRALPKWVNGPGVVGGILHLVERLGEQTRWNDEAVASCAKKRCSERDRKLAAIDEEWSTTLARDAEIIDSLRADHDEIAINGKLRVETIDDEIQFWSEHDGWVATVGHKVRGDGLTEAEATEMARLWNERGDAS